MDPRDELVHNLWSMRCFLQEKVGAVLGLANDALELAGRAWAAAVDSTDERDEALTNLNAAHGDASALREQLRQSEEQLAATQAALTHEEQQTQVLREEKRQRRQSHLEQNLGDKVTGTSAYQRARSAVRARSCRPALTSPFRVQVN